MGQRVTIKDIAAQTGFSVGTVHCALFGKPGVSEQNRARILEAAREMQYRPNLVAASLKRKAIQVAAAFPGPTEENRFYYSFVWEGLRDYLASMADFNVQLIEIPYYSGANGQAGELTDLLARTKVDGLLTAGHLDRRGRGALQQFMDQDIPVVLVGTNTPRVGALCCVQPHYQIAGRMLAELLSRQLAHGGAILLLAGDVTIPSHCETVSGFESYLQELPAGHRIYKVHNSGSQQETLGHISQALRSHGDIAACCSVHAGASVLLGRALLETGKAGMLPAVGTDLFAENLRFLSDGVFSNLLHNHPYLQAHTAARYLLEYILYGKSTLQKIVYVGSEVVFRSNAPMYDNDACRILL